MTEINDKLKMRVAGKVFSGRYFVTVTVVSTYCILILASLLLAIRKLISIDAFLALIGTFALVAQNVITSYFQRNDRIKEDGKNSSGG